MPTPTLYEHLGSLFGRNPRTLFRALATLAFAVSLDELLFHGKYTAAVWDIILALHQHF